MVERNNGFFKPRSCPDLPCTSPTEISTQLADWLPRANARTVRAIGGRPVDLLAADRAAMLALPPARPDGRPPRPGPAFRDCFVRVDTCDYSVDPRVIGRFVDVVASSTEVLVRCGGELVAQHARGWAKRVVVTDPAHVETAKLLRRELAASRDAEHRLARRHGDGHAVMLRALPDYDALFGVDFTPTPTPTPAEGELPAALDSQATIPS